MKLINDEEAKTMSVDAANVLLEKKCEDVLLLSTANATALADYFLIATVRSAPQAQAAIDALHAYFKPKQRIPFGQADTVEESQWILIDYGFLVAHLFTEEGRAFYELEKLWHECPREPFER